MFFAASAVRRVFVSRRAAAPCGPTMVSEGGCKAAGPFAFLVGGSGGRELQGIFSRGGVPREVGGDNV